MFFKSNIISVKNLWVYFHKIYYKPKGLSILLKNCALILTKIYRKSRFCSTHTLEKGACLNRELACCLLLAANFGTVQSFQGTTRNLLKEGWSDI